MRQAGRHGRRRWVQALAVLTAVALFGTWSVWQGSRPLLDQPIPPKVLPSPNALDFYLRAAALEVDSEVIDSPSRHTPAQLADAVERNQPALAELRRGFAYQPRCAPAAAIGPALSDPAWTVLGLASTCRDRVP
ncbi:MAG: hypothetical protein HYU66_19830 [Armatimonadetes bacterium]|nr:hypothetical protein [Armatimonadota bacterium]